MAKFNRVDTRPAVASPIVTARVATGRTHEGAPGFARDAKSELFLLAVANMVGEGTFYEKVGDRDDRYEQLVAEIAVADYDWTLGFLTWLRADGNMRSASLVGAAEAVRARIAAQAFGGNRQLVDAVILRADEPGEMLAYWTSRHGRRVPLPVKNGIADAAIRLYTERNLLKYDADSKGFRFGDVIDLVHPSPKAVWQGALFKHAIDRRHGRDVEIPESLSMLAARADLMSWEPEARRALLRRPDAAFVLGEAGMTWESLSGWLNGPMDATAWGAMIGSMGYMALLRNLRNFDQAGVSDEVADQVAAKLADPAEVARSRQFPFRFYAAHNAVGSLRWGHALEKALAASLANVPALRGRTLILIDQSPSMFPNYYTAAQAVMRDISNADVAKMFGSALALRAADATLIGYGHRNYRVPFARGEAVLKLMGKFREESGTDAYTAARDHFAGHDRIVVVTDGENNGLLKSWEQAGIPPRVPIYSWNIGGYRLSQDPGGPNRHTFAGLTDHAFRMIPLLESGRDGNWPWLV